VRQKTRGQADARTGLFGCGGSRRKARTTLRSLTELVLEALNMAIYTRRPQPRLIHHSDRGSQYTSVEFSSRLREEGLLPPMGSG
jgi:transposase InsO family protein